MVNLFIYETVSEAVYKLRLNGYRVDYKPKPADPESANAYIVCPDKPGDITAVISSVIRWRQAMPHWDLPKAAQACIQLTQKDKRKESRLIECFHSNLTTIPKKGDENENRSAG